MFSYTEKQPLEVVGWAFPMLGIMSGISCPYRQSSAGSGKQQAHAWLPYAVELTTEYSYNRVVFVVKCPERHTMTSLLGKICGVHSHLNL